MAGKSTKGIIAKFKKISFPVWIGIVAVLLDFFLFWLWIIVGCVQRPYMCGEAGLLIVVTHFPAVAVAWPFFAVLDSLFAFSPDSMVFPYVTYGIISLVLVYFIGYYLGKIILWAYHKIRNK
jgi:hypothetical protein